jgi:hypothetical protein
VPVACVNEVSERIDVIFAEGIERQPDSVPVYPDDACGNPVPQYFPVHACLKRYKYLCALFDPVRAGPDVHATGPDIPHPACKWQLSATVEPDIKSG